MLQSFDALADDYSSAKELVNKRKWAEALPILERLHSEAPSSNFIRLDLATSYLRLNERTKSIALLNEAHLQKQAKTAATAFISEAGLKNYQEGLIFLNQLKFKLSLDKFERSQGLEKDHLDILNRLAENEILMGDYVDSRKWVSRIEEVYGLTGESLYWRLILESRSDLKGFPQAKLDQLSHENPSSLSIGLLRVEVLSESGKKMEALSEIETLMKHFPKAQLLPILSVSLRPTPPKDAEERQLREKELQTIQSLFDKEPDSFLLPSAEWGRRLYSLDALQKTLKKTSDSFNQPTPSSAY